MLTDQEKLLSFMTKIAEKHKDLCHPLSDRAIEQMYEKGYFAYKNGNLGEAVRTFQVLCFHRPFEAIYWESLASSLFAKKEYLLSLDAWAMVSIFDKDNNKAPLYSAECYFSLDNQEEGLKALDEAKRLTIEDNPYKNRIELLEEVWGLN